ncbi:hypothetical protein KEM54_001577 [Ascosphaera aggregata]|nr:hypothetical protein KEM54_001577 [Ascosphaera aggregata]
MTDAVPKKRGPKTDVLEALIKRVDGLEKRLKEEQRTPTDAATSEPEAHNSPSAGVKRSSEHLDDQSPDAPNNTKEPSPKEPSAKRPVTQETAIFTDSGGFSTGLTNQGHAPASSTNDNLPSTPPPANQFMVMPDAVLDTFFAHVNEKPFYLLDEQSVRQQHRADQLPTALSLAIYALTMRHTSWSNASIASLRRLSQIYAAKSRQMVDSDTPTLENLQTLLILSLSSLANGQGRKSYMLFGMSFALISYGAGADHPQKGIVLLWSLLWSYIVR